VLTVVLTVFSEGQVAKRRGNGEGSVYRRGDGRIIGEYVDAYGRRRYVSGKTKTEVKAKLRRLLADRDEGIAYDSENLTVGGYLDRWLEAIKGSVRDRTWERHEQVVRVHLKPAIGHVRLDRLNALQAQAVYGRKLEAGLSPRTVQIIHATLHKALKQAVAWTLVPRNVAEAATPPRPVRKEITPLTGEQARSLLEAARGDRLEALYVLAVTTGMRQGELLGLRWEDVDLRCGILKVNRSVYEGVASPPKTRAGRRTIRLSEPAVAALERHRVGAARRSERISGWVFASATGTPIGHQNLRNRSWRPLLERAGLPDSVRFHDLRHTCATLLLARNVNPKIVSEMLGHASVGITLDTYSHLLPNMQQDAAKAMEDALS
jgi:integrase